MGRNDDESNDETERTLRDARVADPVGSVEQADEGEEPIEVEEPGGDLQRLGLHAIEPPAGIESGS